MNKLNLIGRVVKEPNITHTQGSNPMTIAKFTLAVDRKFKKDGEQSADFPNCVAFGKVAEIIEKYVAKGTKIGVSGRIQTGSYTNKDGQKVFTTDVMVEELEFCESKSNTSAPKSSGTDFMNIPDDIGDSLPF